MRVGITYLSRSADIDAATTRRKYAEFFEQVAWADAAGFSGIWITEHHFSTYSLSASPLVLLAKAAAVATRLRLGTGILVLPLWDPRRLVADVSTLDVISGGRVDLGVGRGYQPHEFAGFGESLDASRGKFEQSVELILQLFTAHDTQYQGDFHRVDVPVTVLPRAEQRPHPPIWAAAVSAESTRFAVAHGFHVMGLALATPDQLAAQWRTVTTLAEAAGVADRPREYSANRYVYCGTDPDGRRLAAREAARQMQMSKALAAGGVPAGGLVPGADRIDPADEELAYDRLLAGTPEEIIEQVAAIADAGVTYLSAGFQYGALPSDVATASARLFAAEVLPVVNAQPTRLDITAAGAAR